jgi:hypothetical protein
LRASSFRLVRTWVQIIYLPLGGRREDFCLRDLGVTLSWVKPGLSGLGSRAKVCETPLGIREVEHLLGFLNLKIDQDGDKHNFKKSTLGKMPRNFQYWGG